MSELGAAAADYHHAHVLPPQRRAPVGAGFLQGSTRQGRSRVRGVGGGTGTGAGGCGGAAHPPVVHRWAALSHLGRCRNARGAARVGGLIHSHGGLPVGLGAVQQWATVALEYPALDLARPRDDRGHEAIAKQARITRGAPASPDHAPAPCNKFPYSIVGCTNPGQRARRAWRSIAPFPALLAACNSGSYRRRVPRQGERAQAAPGAPYFALPPPQVQPPLDGPSLLQACYWAPLCSSRAHSGVA